MYTCPNCQQPVKQRSGFCPNCGSSYQIQRGKSKGLKWIILSALLVVALLITHGQIKDRTGAYSTIHEFEKIMSQKDSGKALELFKEQLQDIEPSEKTMAEFMDYVYFETEWKLAIKDWKKVAIRDRDNYETIKSIDGNQLFSLEETGDFLGIYPTYEVVVHPFSLEVKSYIQGTKVMFHNKSKTLQNSEDYQKVASFLPTYTDQEIIYSVESEYASIEDTLSFTSSAYGDNTVYVELDIEAALISVSSNEVNAIVFINGESTKKTVGEIGLFGPIPLDGSFTVHAEIDDRVSYREDIYYEEDYELWFEEEYAEEVIVDVSSSVSGEPSKDELEFLYDSFQQTAVDAINARDYSIVESYYHPEGISGPESANYMNYLDSKGITEQLVESEVLSFEISEGGIFLNTFESYIIYTPDKPSVQKSFNTQHYLKLDGDEWKFYQLMKTTEI